MSLIIYEHIHFNGEHRHIYTNSEFSLFTFNQKVSSIEILDGEYEFYDQTHFTGAVLKLGKGSYPNLVERGWNDRILSIKRISSKNVNTRGMILYADKDFKGAHKHIMHHTSQLSDDGWNDRVSSIQIVSGQWRIFSDAGFSGNSVLLGPGIYPNASAIGLNDNTISSIRLVNEQAQGPILEEMIVFDAHSFSGSHLHLVSSGIRNLSDHGWNDRILSLIVLRGADWMLFRDWDWNGPNVILPPGAFGTFATATQKKLLFPLQQVSSIRNMPVNTEIENKYHALGGPSGWLGEPLQPEDICLDGYGSYRHYRNGSIYWHPESGAFEVHGLIRDKWREMGADQGTLGYPISDEMNSRDGISQVSHFQRGSIYYTHQRRKMTIVAGKCWEKWAEMNLEKGPLGHPILEKIVDIDLPRLDFQHGSIIKSETSRTPVSIFIQNMALLAFPGFYPPESTIFSADDSERIKAINALVIFLRENRFDFVGLCEVFSDGERASIAKSLATIYPFSSDGPDEADLESDGGLFLLSRHRIILKNGSIFRQCKGDDCTANKGVLHIRASIPNHSQPYDIFLTHTQNPDEGGKEQARNIVDQQLLHLNSFIMSVRDHNIPAILMGDINTNMEDLLLSRQLKKILHQPDDVWEKAGNGTQGFTLDPVNTARVNARPLSPVSQLRHQNGERVDAILSWKGGNVWPVFEDARVVVLQRSAGIDVSDHYGIRSSFRFFTTFQTVITRAMAGVTVTLTRFHCLETTAGSGADEVQFSLKIKPANGPESAQKSTGVIRNINNGNMHHLQNPLSVSVNDPGNDLTITVKGKEIDPISDDDMGTSTLTITRAELLEMMGRQVTRAMPRLRKAGGEYVLFVTISVMMVDFG